MAEQIFLSPQMKRSMIISSKQVASRVTEQPKIYNLRKLGNIRKTSELHRIIARAQPSSWNENFVSTSKNLLKNRN